MKLSIIVPCFNAADTVAEQLEALANQRWSEPWEIIIADNGSTDNSLAIVERYQTRLPQLRVVDASQQQGTAYARNTGAKAARGEAIAFCDADDEVAEGWVAAIGEALSKYDFVACRFDCEKLNESWTTNYRSEQLQTTGPIEYKYPAYLPHAAGASLGIKRSVHEAIGGFDETLLCLEDTDYCWRLQLAGTKLHFVPDAVIYYRFRHTVGGLYRQARFWGEYNVFLYKKYRALGMSELSWQASVKAWLHLLKCMGQIFSSKDRAKWLWLLAWRVGRLQGCLKHRVLAI